MGNWGVVASDTIGIDTVPPLGSLHSITETGPYAYAGGDTAYYSNVGSGSFSVQVAAEDAGSGLDRAEYPETTSPGGVYHTAGRVPRDDQPRRGVPHGAGWGLPVPAHLHL